MKIKKWIQKKYLSRYFVVYIISFVISHRILNWRCHWLTSKIVWFDTISCLGLSYDNVVTSKPRYVLVCTIGWAQWNLSCFEFKFDDTRLSSWYKNKIGPIEFFLLRPDVAKSLPCWLSQFSFSKLRQPKLSNIRTQQKKI